MQESRRLFLKAALAAGVAATAPVSARAIGYEAQVPREVAQGKGYCPFCQARCTYTATLHDGKIVSLTGEKDNYWTGGAMCPKGMSIVELLQSPYRLTEPMLRQADGSWKQISYQAAIEFTAARLKETLAKNGKKAGERVALTMPLWDCLESELAALMALRAVGSVQAMPPGETCVSTASNMLGAMIGVNCGSTQVDELPKAKAIVLWGANVNDLYPCYSRWILRAKEAGARIIYIDPRKTRTSIWADFQLRPRPGTDGVLALGAIRHILQTNSYDLARAQSQIADLENLQPQTEKYTPEFVAQATGLNSEEISRFYAVMAANEPTIAWLGGSLSRQTNGIVTTRAIILLQALTDNLIGRGKGILTFQSGKPGGGEELVNHFFGENNAPKMNFRKLRNAMSKGRVDVLFLNSSYRRNPDALGVAKAIRKVPFVVHMGFFPDEELEVSHLFIPATFGPESTGLGYGNENQVTMREKLVPAPGSCVPAWQFYRDVGRLVDPDRYPEFADATELAGMLCKYVPSWKGMTLERLRVTPTLTWPIYEEGGKERSGSVFTEGRLLTPDGKMRVTDPVFGGIGNWDYPKGHPAGKNADKAFPLVLTQGKQLWHWQQTLTNFAQSMAQFCNGRFVQINPLTARELGLVQKDKVILETAQGGLEAWVDITDSVLPGCVFTPANCNRTTPIPANASPSICNILPNYWDRISAQHNGTGCRLRKLEG